MRGEQEYSGVKPHEDASLRDAFLTPPETGNSLSIHAMLRIMGSACAFVISRSAQVCCSRVGRGMLGMGSLPL